MFKQIRCWQLMLAILCAGLMLGAISCGTDDDNMPVEEEVNLWVGTWNLKTFEGESVQSLIAATEQLLAAFGETDVNISYSDIWTFNNDGTWQRDITTVIDEETTSHEVLGTYALSDANYALTPTASTIPVEESNVEVEVVDVEVEVVDVEVEVVDVEVEVVDVEVDDNIDSVLELSFGNTEVDTGTWSLDGDILTLTSDTGKVYEFKKV